MITDSGKMLTTGLVNLFTRSDTNVANKFATPVKAFETNDN
jgi:hypothetical protein